MSRGPRVSASVLEALERAVAYYEFCWATLGEDFEDCPPEGAERERWEEELEAARRWLDARRTLARERAARRRG